MKVLLIFLSIWSCVFWDPLLQQEYVSEPAERAEKEFRTWLTTPKVQDVVQERKLAGSYLFTVILDAKGKVQTVFADENPEQNLVAQQNEVARLIRTFKCSIHLKNEQKIKFKPAFNL